jgi:hypothetical protein
LRNFTAELADNGLFGSLARERQWQWTTVLSCSGRVSFSEEYPMPWTVRLEDEHGIPETDEFLVIEFGSLPLGKAYPISSLIDSAPYYDTLLNPVQVKAFIAEIDAGDPNCSEALPRLRSLAQRATAPHIYLRFIGD